MLSQLLFLLLSWQSLVTTASVSQSLVIFRSNHFFSAAAGIMTIALTLYWHRDKLSTLCAMRNYSCSSFELAVASNWQRLKSSPVVVSLCIVQLWTQSLLLLRCRYFAIATTAAATTADVRLWPNMYLNVCLEKKVPSHHGTSLSSITPVVLISKIFSTSLEQATRRMVLSHHS